MDRLAKANREKEMKRLSTEKKVGAVISIARKPSLKKKSSEGEPSPSTAGTGCSSHESPIINEWESALSYESRGSGSPTRKRCRIDFDDRCFTKKLAGPRDSGAAPSEGLGTAGCRGSGPSVGLRRLEEEEDEAVCVEGEKGVVSSREELGPRREEWVSGEGVQEGDPGGPEAEKNDCIVSLLEYDAS
eukprot:GHVU01166324.1.p1 GENE.GHVU01166324.1~~GHVU01166324.1.p1  ORF type:complete len:188 (+),score=23.24 GHVU01166324.1:651-1214(+)